MTDRTGARRPRCHPFMTGNDGSAPDGSPDPARGLDELRDELGMEPFAREVMPTFRPEGGRPAWEDERPLGFRTAVHPAAGDR